MSRNALWLFITRRSVAVLRFCLEGTSSRDHAQFTVRVTAVVALMAPLEPVTVTV